MTKEIWRPVPGFIGYDVSNIGHVRSYWDNAGQLNVHPVRIMSVKPSPNGYVSHRLKLPDGQQANSQRRYKYIGAHRLVVLAFIGPPPHHKSYVCHWNGIKDDNRIENLRYDTPKGNMEDAIRHGTLLNGSDVNTARLFPELVVAIRWLYINDRASQRELAKLFDISRSQIQNIVNGESWKHLWDHSISQGTK